MASLTDRKFPLQVRQEDPVRAMRNQGPVPLLAVAQGLLGAPALVDVLDRGHRSDGPTGGVADHRHVDVHPDRRAVLADVPFLQLIGCRLAPHDPLEQHPVTLPVVGVRDVRNVQREQLGGFVISRR